MMRFLPAPTTCAGEERIGSRDCQTRGAATPRLDAALRPEHAVAENDALYRTLRIGMVHRRWVGQLAG
jgi:hypothetical protein